MEFVQLQSYLEKPQLCRSFVVEISKFYHIKDTYMQYLKITLLILLFTYQVTGQSIPLPVEVPDYPKKEGVVYNSKTNFYGILDSQYNIVVPFEYYYLHRSLIGDFVIAKKRKNGLYGIISSKNEIKYDFQYSHINAADSYFIAYIDNDEKVGCLVIDLQNNKELISLEKGYSNISSEFKIISHFKTINDTTYPPQIERYFKAHRIKDNITEFLSLSGEILKTFKFSDVKPWGEYYISILNRKQGVLSISGQELLKPDYELVNWIDNNRACVYKSMAERKAYIIDLNSGNIINSNWSTVRRQEEDNGCMVVTKWVNGKEYSGIVDSNYNEVLSPCNCDITYSLISKEFEVINKETKEMKKIAYEELKQK